jgi:hypothetical protein
VRAGRRGTGPELSARRDARAMSLRLRAPREAGRFSSDAPGYFGCAIASIHDLQPRSIERSEQLGARFQAQVLREIRKRHPALARWLQARRQRAQELPWHATAGVVDCALDGRARPRGNPGRAAYDERGPPFRKEVRLNAATSDDCTPPAVAYRPASGRSVLHMRRGRRGRSGHPDGRLSDREAGYPTLTGGRPGFAERLMTCSLLETMAGRHVYAQRKTGGPAWDWPDPACPSPRCKSMDPDAP